MAGVRPTFTTGSRIRIKLNGKTIAHAQNLGYGFSVMVEPVYTMGEYGAVSAVVSGYSGVQGSLQIINLLPKTTRDAIQAAVIADKDKIAELSATGVITPQLSIQKASGAVSSISIVDDPSITNPLDEAKYHLHPEKVLLSQSFDLQVFVRNFDSATGKYQEFLQWEIKDCRFSGRSSQINPGSPVGMDFQYKGILLVNKSRPVGSLERTDINRDSQGT